MKRIGLIAAAAATVISGSVLAMPITIAGTPSNFSFSATSTDVQPSGVTASQTITFDKIELGPDQNINNVVIEVGSDFTTTLEITNNSGADAGVSWSAEAIQTATSPSDSDQLSDPNATLTTGAFGTAPDGVTTTFSDSVLGLTLSVDLGVNDFIASGPGETVDVIISAVFNVTQLALFGPGFAPADPADFDFNWTFDKADFNIQAIAQVETVPVPATVVLLALGLVGFGVRLRRLVA